MSYLNPGQLFQEYFQPTVRSVLPIVPSLMANRRAQEEMLLRETLQQRRWENEGGLRQAQARHYNAQAEEAESANQIRNQLMGGQGNFAGFGIKPEDIIRKGLGLPAAKEPTLGQVYDPGTKQYTWQERKPGDIAKPEAESLSKYDYWIKGPEGKWTQTSEMIPKETYTQRVKEIETQGGQMNEPEEVSVQKKVAEYEALAPKKLAALETQLKARGVDVSKWSQQQKFWYQIVKDKANREIQIVSNTATSLKQAKADLEEIEKEVFSEVQRIAIGQPPTYMTPPGGAQPGAPGPLPIVPSPQPQAAPQAGGGEGAPPVSKLKEGVITTFKNGQAWTIENGQPKRVR